MAVLVHLAACVFGGFPWLEVVVVVTVEPLSRVFVDAAEVAKMVAKFGRLVEVVVVVWI